MVNKKKCLGILVMVMVFSLSIISCENDETHTHSYGTTWKYDATQHWLECSCGEKKDIANHTFTDDICTVCGYEKTPENIPPEQKPTAERWSTWTAEDTNVTVNISVGADDVCTIIVGGTVDEDIWKAQARYSYTALENKKYYYEFEAWSDSERQLLFQYYNDWENAVQIHKFIDIYPINTEYTEQNYYFILGEKIPKNSINGIEFGCANQLGTVYIKIINIGEQEIDNRLVLEDGYVWVGNQFSNSGYGYIFKPDGTFYWVENHNPWKIYSEAKWFTIDNKIFFPYDDVIQDEPISYTVTIEANETILTIFGGVYTGDEDRSVWKKTELTVDSWYDD